MPAIARHKSDKKDKMSSKLGSVFLICSYTGRGGRQDKKKRIKRIKVSAEAILVHTVSGKYGGSYSTRKDRKVLSRHYNINWKPCRLWRKQHSSYLIRGAPSPRVRWKSQKKKENGSPKLASMFLASVIEFFRVWFTIVEKIKKKGGHSRRHGGLGVFTVHNYQCNPVGSSYSHCLSLSR